MEKHTQSRLNLFSATNLVIANIIGAGIFTTSGYTLGAVPSAFGLMLIWFLGGVLALCGALAYGELSSIMPKSGGEYYYLSRLYHPLLGFLSGFVSLTAGFAAPVAAAGLGFGKYLTAAIYGQSDDTLTRVFAIIIIVLLSLLHTFSLKQGALIQNILTSIKVALIVFFITAGLFFTPSPQSLSLMPAENDWALIFQTGFAVSLVYISFAYSGWNAAAYMSEEVENPSENVPRALLYGTLVVTGLYMLVNFVFLYSSPIPALQNKAEVGDVAAKNIFGEHGGQLMSTFIALALTSSMSAMIMAGPRVIQAMGKDFPIFSKFAQNNTAGIPTFALWTQSALSILVVLFSALENVLSYIGFTLSIFTFMTVLGLVIYKLRTTNAEHPIKVPLYPIPVVLFLSLTLWMIVFNLMGKPIESLYGLGTLGIGAIIYFLTGEGGRKK